MPSVDERQPLDPTAGEDRILTIPNALSLGRLACVPVFVWLMFGRRNKVAAAVLLGSLGITDWVDGFIARRFNQVSTVGKVLDPTADRVLLVTGMVAILIDGAVPKWVGWLAVSREVTVGTGAVALAAMGARRVDVTWAGKCGTFGMMVAFPLFLLSNAENFRWRRQARVAAWPCALVALGYSWYSAAGYVKIGKEALRARDGDVEETPEPHGVPRSEQPGAAEPVGSAR
ncbi:MAG TPA: CDP-alcohol phosphatidyltransferase family protein [Acidimicrobiales bacterium]|nr:CDP-alcohol phosphatidyltransferase family protein [Acidimicrobiales bacterium]